MIAASVHRLRLAFIAAQRGKAATAETLLALQQEADPGDVIWPGDPLERLVVERSVPRWLALRLVKSLGDSGADRFLEVVNRPGPATLRAHALCLDRGGLIKALADEGIEVRENNTSPWAVDVVGHANLFGSRSWRRGLFEVQDAGSQRIALATRAAPGEIVVDLCAGRGGKTLALAAMMQNRGALHVHDVDDRALRQLRGRLGRAGVTCVVEGLPSGGADVVLADVPCSSTGTLRRSPDLRFTLQSADVDALIPLQRQLLEQASALARVGGRVIYATCSVLEEENAAVVASAPPALMLRATEQLLPHVDGTDGFFIAVFEKSC